MTELVVPQEPFTSDKCAEQTVMPESSQDAVDDPYAYLERGDFSSENFKIEIKNLPKFYGMNELRKLLNEKLGLNSNKIKTPRRNCPYAFVCFRNDEDRDKAMKAITGYRWKRNILKAIKAKAAPDPLVKKRNADGHENVNKKAKLDGQSQEERLKMSTIPFGEVPYDEQLKKKQEDIRKILTKLGNDLCHHNPRLRPWMEEQKLLHNGLPCQLLDIKHSDKIDGYRNKCEFTVGMDEITELPTVGFRIGSYVTGVTGVGPINSLRHIPASMKVAVELFQDFVRKSDLQAFNPEIQTGNFRQLTVRSASDQLMLVVGIHPQNLSKETLTQFKEDLIKFFFEGPGKNASVTSLYYQAIVKKNSGESPTPPEHLHGDTHIYETILGLKFRISPEAFFQINSPGAEVLYSAAIDLASPSQTSTVVDICCGTGTIGLCFAKSCGQVLGLELVPRAVLDAKQNAEANKIENASFYEGKAEDILSSVFYRAAAEDVITIVDPPRAGLHQRAIMQLRKTTKMNKLLYISCNPGMAFKNFIDLGRPSSKTMHGEPLIPVKAVAVDMFPHTKHCELLIYFERWNDAKFQPNSEINN